MFKKSDIRGLYGLKLILAVELRVNIGCATAMIRLRTEEVWYVHGMLMGCSWDIYGMLK